MVSIYIPYINGQRVLVTSDEHYASGVYHTHGHAVDLIAIDQYGNKIYHADLVSPVYGTVIHTDTPNNLGSGYGNRVVIEFEYDGSLYWTAINHMHFDSIDVFVGQKVTPGTYLGQSGYTGYTEPYGFYGEHLHLDVYDNKQAAINGEYYGATAFTFYEDPNGSFRGEILTSQNTPQPAFPPLTISQHVFTDLNGDGRDDITLHHASGELSSRNGGGARIEDKLYHGHTSWDVFGTADINGDGRQDVIQQEVTPGSASHGSLHVWFLGKQYLGLNTGDKDPNLDYFGVLERDNQPDRVLYKSTLGPEYYAKTWTGAGMHLEKLGDIAGEWTVLGTGDYARDGRDDLLLQHRNGWVNISRDGYQHLGYGVVQLDDKWRYAGSGQFFPEQFGGETFLFVHEETRELRRYEGSGRYHSEGALPDDVAIVGVGDLDGDGTDDLVVKRGSDLFAYAGTNLAATYNLDDLPSDWRLI